MKLFAKLTRVAAFLTLGMMLSPTILHAMTAQEIDTKTEIALERFKEQVFGADEMLKRAKGVLIFPRVIKGGFVFGGEYGEGVLQVKGKKVDYYNIISGSWGIQFGIQTKAVFLIFMEESALRSFQASNGWQVGVDGSVALIKVGASASVDTTKTNEPILAFVLGQKGLMWNLTMEGSKFNQIVR